MEKAPIPFKGKLLTYQPPNYHSWEGQFMTQCQSQFSLLARSLPTGDFLDSIAEFRRARDISRLPSKVQFPLNDLLKENQPQSAEATGLRTPPNTDSEGKSEGRSTNTSSVRIRANSRQTKEELKYAEECRFKDVMKLPAVVIHYLCTVSSLIWHGEDPSWISTRSGEQ
jgi:hypothetical protein